MKVIDREYVESHKDEIIEAIRGGSIFIYPTDTIYGLGCNAMLEEAVAKIREMKQRDTKSFSVIAPSKEWILKSVDVDAETVDKYLPGPYTIISSKIGKPFADNVTLPHEIGVRIPGHWFTKMVEECGVPFVTTSVNVAGEKHMENLEEVPQPILDQVDYVVYEGEKKGVSSTKINLITNA